MTNEQVPQGGLPTATTAQDSGIPRPVKGYSYYFQPPIPPSSSLQTAFDEKNVGICVKVETCEGHNNVEQFVLNRQKCFGESVVGHNAFVI